MKRFAERLELEAFHDLFSVAPDRLDARRLESSAGALAFRLTALADAREFNRILGLSRADELDELGPLYEGARFWVSLDPAARLASELTRRGFSPDYPWQKFERDVTPLAARTELDVAEPRRAGDFGGALAAGYGLPPPVAAWAERLVGRPGWTCLVAYDGERAAGVGALFSLDGYGWLGLAATLPSHRGRGAQSALLAARVDRARDLGHRAVVTETGVPGHAGPGASFRNIVRAGFRPTYVRPNYASPAG
jgi:GNAT superfamily N-acetyltransferase